MYLNDVDLSANRCQIEAVAFEQDNRPLTTTTDTDALPPLPIPNSPHTSSLDGWCYSSCSLESVTEIHPCTNKKSLHPSVMGMLLCYADGHRECVGEFRLDWVAKPVMVRKMDNIYIFREGPSGGGRGTNTYVTAVTTRASESRVESRWHEVAQAGTLDWWFKYGSILYHNGRRLG